MEARTLTNAIRLPVIVLNFKTYIEALGPRAISLAKICRKVSLKTNINIAVAPQFTDIPFIAKERGVAVLAQHVDNVPQGSYTGHILPEAVKNAGAVGTLLNHSERRIAVDTLRECVERCRTVGLTTLVCADTPEACRTIATLHPDMIAVEPPELIGTGIAVSKMKPQVVTESIRLVKIVNENLPVLCGAGVSTPEDVEAAINLGTKGVLLASAVVKSKQPEKLLISMATSMLRTMRR